MPRGPRSAEIASLRLVVLITPSEQVRYRALAEHEAISLSEIIRGDLDARIARLERRGVTLPKKKRARRK